VPLSHDAQEKAAFITRDGPWKWKVVLPFGLKSAPTTFPRFIKQDFGWLHWKTLLIYLSDAIVISPDFTTQVSLLQKVFDRLQAARLKLKPSKFTLLQPKVKYFGHVTSREGVATDLEKVQAVKK